MLSLWQLTNPEVNTLSSGLISNSEEPLEYHTEGLHVFRLLGKKESAKEREITVQTGLTSTIIVKLWIKETFQQYAKLQKQKLS